MKISIFVPIGNIGNTPDYWQYAWCEALDSYCDFADEVVVVVGNPNGYEQATGEAWTHWSVLKLYNEQGDKLKFVEKDWPYEFSWEQIAQAFNAGLEACTGDWIIKMDIDYIIHEKYMEDFRKKLELAMQNKFELASYMKATVLNKDEYYLKLAVPFCIRGDKKDKYKFGIPLNDPKSAWGYPIIVNGEIDTPRDLPVGANLPDVDSVAFRTGINIYNYDNTFRNKKITGEHFYRFSRARERAGFGLSWGNSEERALYKFSDMMASRIKKTKGLRKRFSEEDGHPKYIKDRIDNLTPDQFGYNNWDNFKGIL